MPAIMDDPNSPTIYRVSGEPPYPDHGDPSLPADIVPRQVTLRDRQTFATIVPFASPQQVPLSLLVYLSDQFAREIEKGDTYPMVDPMPFEKFASYWFQNFGAIMLLGSIERPEDVVEDKDWSKECLGSFYIKPNYPGRSSHVCNAGFLVTDASRNRGVGRLMGEAYIDWAPKLGYTYSVFNLVYETNVASCKIWDALGFKRIGRVKGCGNLKSYPGRLIDAIIYGRDLSVNGESEELVSEERFDKIKFYLKHGKYPNGADRAEKSRLRSAATHYKLLDGDKLMLKDKEVISDPQRQYDIARQVHAQQHGGINKTTATIAEKYHWSRIKETVSDVIRACTECKDTSKSNSSVVVTQKKPPTPNQNSAVAATTTTPPDGATVPSQPPAVAPIPAVSLAPALPALADLGVMAASDRREGIQYQDHLSHFPVATYAVHHPHDMSVNYPAQTLHTPTDSPVPQHTNLPASHQHHARIIRHSPTEAHQLHSIPRHTPMSDPGAPSLPLSVAHSHEYQPIDPQIMDQTPLGHPSASSYAHHHPIHLQHHHDSYASFHNPHTDADTFQDLLAVGHNSHVEGQDDDEVDRDLDMILMEQQDDEVDDGSARMDIDDLGVGVPGAGLVDPGVDHDDLSKMSVGHVLATPEPDGPNGPDGQAEASGEGSEHASRSKERESDAVFGYPAPG